MISSQVNLLWKACRSPVTHAIVGCTQVRAALNHAYSAVNVWLYAVRMTLPEYTAGITTVVLVAGISAVIMAAAVRRLRPFPYVANHVIQAKRIWSVAANGCQAGKVISLVIT